VIAARAVGRLLVDHGILGGEKVRRRRDPRLAAETGVLATRSPRRADVTRVPLADALGTSGRGWVSSIPHESRPDRLRSRRGPPRSRRRPPKVRASRGCKVVLDPDAGGFRIVTARTARPPPRTCGHAAMSPFTSVAARRRGWHARRATRHRGLGWMAKKIVCAGARTSRSQISNTACRRGYLDIEEVSATPGSARGPVRARSASADGDAAREADRQAAVGDPAVHVAAPIAPTRSSCSRCLRTASLRDES